MIRYTFQIIFIVSIISFNLYPQINGLSASKLFVYDALNIKPGIFEVELCTKVFTAKSFFDGNGNSTSLNGRLYKSELDFRFTFGVYEFLEIGVEIPNELDKFYLGTKFHLYKNSFLHLSGMAGAGYGILSRFVADGNNDDDRYENISFGGASTINITGESTIDIHLIYSNVLKDEIYRHIHFAAGYGHYFSDVLQLVIEINGKKQISGENNIDKIMLVPGITFDPAENFSVTAALPIDITGKNSEKGFAIFTGFTIWFD